MATITKILETTIAAGGTTATFTDAEIPNSLLRIHSTDPNIYPLMQTLSGNTVTVTYEEQVRLLKTKGLIIEDKQECIDFLKHTNYYLSFYI